jgi:hypothetical protein
MKKSTKLILDLTKAREFKDNLENIIEIINKEIQAKNIDEKTNIDILEDLKWKASNLLIDINVKMQKANIKKISLLDPISNAHTIKKLSELQRELKHLNNIVLPIEQENKKKKKVSSLFKSHISKDDIDKRTRTLQQQIGLYQNRLKVFNQKNKITIKITKDIQEVIDYINNNLKN